MTCCKNVLKVCALLPDCMELLRIQVPPAYNNPEGIGIEITNGKGQMIRLVDQDYFGGFVELDLTDTEVFPPGFFNPYGGIYQLQYFETGIGTLVTFDGNDTVAFEIGQFSDSDGQLEPFGMIII